MSDAMPKEQQSAYQRWEMASLGDPPGRARDASQQQNDAQLKHLREAARREGYAAGLEAGKAEGRTAGMEAGRMAAVGELALLKQAALAFGTEIERINDTVAADLLQLALDISRAMLRTALEVQPELVLALVEDSVRALPNVQQPALLVMNPEDAELVKAAIGEELERGGWRMSTDPRMARGGCRIETATNQIDATPATRWKRIAAALGANHAWMEP